MDPISKTVFLVVMMWSLDGNGNAWTEREDAFSSMEACLTAVEHARFETVGKAQLEDEPAGGVVMYCTTEEE